MKTYTKDCEYAMEKTGDSFTFSVREGKMLCKVRIDHITEKGASLFLSSIRKFDVRACQLTAVAEDEALSAVTEIFKGLL